MGFSISWVAVNGKAKSRVLAELDLIDTDEVDPANEAPVSGAELPDDWYLLFLNDLDHSFTKAVALERLSAQCLVLACQVEEHVMASAAYAYQNGRVIWRVSHESELGGRHLAEQGDLPEIYADIRSRLLAEQDEMDENSEPVDCVWDIPVTLAYELCGYRHDNVYLKSGGELQFTVVTQPARGA